eukprot:g50134.t1
MNKFSFRGSPGCNISLHFANAFVVNHVLLHFLQAFVEWEYAEHLRQLMTVEGESLSYDIYGDHGFTGPFDLEVRYKNGLVLRGLCWEDACFRYIESKNTSNPCFILQMETVDFQYRKVS